MEQSIFPVSVLGPVDNANNSATTCAAGSCDERTKVISGEYQVNKDAITSVRKQLTQLFAACEPVIHNRVSVYLAMTEGPDAQLIAAWSRFGRADRQRTVDLRLNDVAKRTISPLGFACLIAYARAWLDEAESMAAESAALASSCLGPEARKRKSPPAAASRRPQARAAAACKRK